MSVKDQISSYLNKFVALVNHKSDAKLELICKGGHVTVNILHDLGVVEETINPSETKPTYTDILKKNVSLSQVNRLYRRSLARTEEVREAIIEQNKLTETAKVVLETATKEFNDYKIRVKKAQIEANNSKWVAEQAKVETEKAKALKENSKIEIIIIAETKSEESNLFDIQTANIKEKIL